MHTHKRFVFWLQSWELHYILSTISWGKTRRHWCQRLFNLLGQETRVAWHSRYPSLKSLRSVKPIFSLWDIFSKTIVSSLTKIQIATAAATACAGLIIIVHQIDNVTILETNGCYSLPTRRWYPICFIPLFKQTDVGGAQFMFLTDFVIQNFGCIRHINGDSFHWAYLRLNSQDL